jgi:predicted 3-demethylubiquinone-9 3-methyltransferase (glyoxalase superfamily)
MGTGSAAKQNFTFNPAISLFVKCDAERSSGFLKSCLVAAEFLTPPAAYPFSNRFCWVVDRFGLSRPLSLES